MAAKLTKTFIANFAYELVKNDSSIKNYSGIDSPAALAKKWTPKAEKVVYRAVGDFLQKDDFFRIIGDKPMPSVTPQSFSSVVKMLVTAKGAPAKEAEVLKRLQSNVLLKWAMGKTYGREIANSIKT
ncbi:MAG: hypothetical protein ABJF86_08330 [Tateyamaria sp.]|uniref:hypothetical protein n=1 Tax=Tateyamaria sp. TaxID=1929288 RepID=UPI0032712C7B